MRKFYKISKDEFSKLNLSDDLYDTYKLPERSTLFSAGYDFVSLYDCVINPKEIKKIPTGIKADMEEDEVLLLIVRSSMGFKYNVRMCNQIGVIDKDYFNNNSNEGHIFICLQNEGDKPFIINKGDKICQGIFVKYLKVDDEDVIFNKRCGGIGSTSKEENNGK